MKIEFEDPESMSRSFDMHFESEPQFNFALSPIKTRKMSKKPKIAIVEDIIKKQYYGSLLLMTMGLTWYFMDFYFTSEAYRFNDSTTPYDVALLKGLVGLFVSLFIAQCLNINPFKFNIQLNLSLDNEEVTDTETMRFWFLTSFIGTAAFVLEANAIKYIPSSTSNWMVSSNSILILVTLPICFKERLSSIWINDIYSILVLILSISILMFEKYTTADSLQLNQNLIGYVWSVASAVSISFSLILLHKLNKKCHYIYYCVYFSIGYLASWLLAYVISADLVDISKFGIWDAAMWLISGVFCILFTLFVSLAHKFSKPTQLAPMWSLVVILSVIKEVVLQDGSSSIMMIIGGTLAVAALLMPLLLRIFKQDVDLVPENQIDMLRRFSSF